MLLYTRLAPPKEPKRRSRAGCTYCKEKKKKCDEKQPECSRCVEHGTQCIYESVKPRKRRKHDLALPNVSSSLDNLSSSRENYQHAARRLSTASHGSSFYTVDHSTFSTDGDCKPFRGRLLSMTDFDDHFVVSPSTESAFDRLSLMAFSPASLSDVSPLIDHIYPPRVSEDGSMSGQGDHREGQVQQSALVLSHHQQLSHTCTTTTIPPRPPSTSFPSSNYPHLAMIAPSPVVSPLLEFRSPAFQEFSDRPNRRALVDHFCNVLSHLIVFREESGNPFQQLVLPLTRKSSPVMNAIFALASAHLEYRGVNNMEKSLWFHNRAIQGLTQLIQLNDKANRNEILAAIMLLVYYEVLVQRGRSNIVHGHLKGALTVMCTNPEPSDPTSVFLERAFRFYDVIAALSNGTAPLSAAPAPGCLLPFPPLGAATTSPLSTVDTLLGMATTLWPIIHRLSSLLSVKTELEEAIRTNAMSSKIAVLRTEFESTAQAIELALVQWRPILPPGFVPDQREMSDPTFIIDNTAPTTTTSTTTINNINNEDDGDISTAIDYNKESNLANPSGNNTAPGTPTPNPTSTTTTTTNKNNNNNNNNNPLPPSSSPSHSRIHSILHNALAYRHSALVYLYRTIYSRPRSHASVQVHAHLSLQHCVATVCHAGPMGALLWPLFVAACEAVCEKEDRELARRAFDRLKQRQGMMNIERAWEIVAEVWRRADVVEGVEGTGERGGDIERELEGREGEGGSCRGDEAMVDDGIGDGEDGDDDGGGGTAAATSTSSPADLWRRVSEDMGVNIVFG